MKTVGQIFVLSEDCKNWIDENVNYNSWNWLGKSLVIETRYIGDIINGMLEDGLELNVDFNIG